MTTGPTSCARPGRRESPDRQPTPAPGAGGRLRHPSLTRGPRMPIGRLLPALVLLLVLVAPRPAAAAPRAQDCTFELGFQALHDLIPDVVGDCAAEVSTSVGGDAQQQTANGLLVWRKADNWTA